MNRLLTFAALITLCLLPLPSRASGGLINQLREGHWVEVRGTFDGAVFEASRIDLRNPARRLELRGVAKADPAGSGFRVLGRVIQVDPDTRGGHRAARLIGKVVRVRGELTRDGQFRATRIDRRSSPRERLRGRISHITPHPDGSADLDIAGFTVRVPEDTPVRTRVEPDEARRTLPVPLATSGTPMADHDDLLGTGWQLGSAFHLGARQDVTLLDRNNFELDDRADADPDADDDRRDTTLRTRARLTWSSSPRLTGVIEGQYDHRIRRLREGESGHQDDFRLRAAFLMLRDLVPGGDLAIGRQDFDDPREWVYDADLDAVRYFTQTRRINWEVSYGRVLEGGSERDEASHNSTLYVSNRYGEDHRAFYAVHRTFDRSPTGRSDREGDRLTHFGVRALESFNESIDGWLDVSALIGSRSTRDVRAWAVDTGLRWSSADRNPFVITAGYARASGDKGGNVDTGFRQTGLQDNEARLGGVNPVRYYGEALDPELANLQIVSLSLAKRFAGRNSVELIGHTYRQVIPGRTLPNTGVDRRPNGESTDLGWAIDAVLGLREFERWEVNLVGGYFQPGEAFDDADPAWLGELQLTLRF